MSVSGSDPEVTETEDEDAANPSFPRSNTGLPSDTAEEDEELNASGLESGKETEVDGKTDDNSDDGSEWKEDEGGGTGSASTSIGRSRSTSTKPGSSIGTTSFNQSRTPVHGRGGETEDTASTIANFGEQELEQGAEEGLADAQIRSNHEQSGKSPNTDDENTEKHDFGQAELEGHKKTEEEMRKKNHSWGSEYDEDGDAEETEEEEDGSEAGGGGMQELLGRSAKRRTTISKEQKDEQPQRRRRKKKPAQIQKVEKTVKAEETLEMEWVEPSYDSDDFVSGPILTRQCRIYPRILHFFQSYGYDCIRPYNLHTLDDNTVVYITGNYIHFFKLAEMQVVGLRRSASGYGIGHIAIHPEKKYYAVAEKGDRPMIVVYSWPNQNVFRVLRNGTSLGYSYVHFSSNGELLCSQGMEPDYLLTIWKWQRERIVLHVKAFSQDIYRATFSATHPGHLTTCGIGHIRFWKMAETFTGLKLQGLIGRFGKTEISDITGFAGLQDGKVVSGSEWGNLLVWDGGLIVVEIVQKTGKNCHDGEITDVLLLETGEVLTVGLDGYIKLWDSDIIDTADTIVDDSGKFQMEPIFELKLSHQARPVSVIRRLGEDESCWLVQDGWGRVWNASITAAMKDPEYHPVTLFSCPGGSINCICVCPLYTMMAVGTSTGHLWIIEYITRQTLAKIKYGNNVSITKLIWLPQAYDFRATSFLVSFSDGNVRLLAVGKLSLSDIDASVDTINITNNSNATTTIATTTDNATASKGQGYEQGGDSVSITSEQHSANVTQTSGISMAETIPLPFTICLLQILRFHKSKINVMKLDEGSSILYTCAEDKVIFASKIVVDHETFRPYVQPLSFVTAPFSVISLDLHPLKDYRLVIASRNGRIAECRRPIWGQLETDTSFNQGKLHGRKWQYTSVKSARRKVERKIQRKMELDKKIEELKADIAERRSRGIFVEEEIEINRLVEVYKRMQMKDDETDLFIPEKPCPVLAVYYRINKKINENIVSRNFFLHVAGYDAGYIYECKCSRNEPGGFHVIPPTPPFQEDVAIRSYIISPDNAYLIFGMHDGSIRVMGRYTPPDPWDIAAQNNEKKKAAAMNLNFGEEPPLEATANEGEGDENLPESEETITTNPDPNRIRKNKKAIPPFPVTEFPYDLSQFVCLPMHDPNRGPVNDLAWGSDGKFLFSVAEDGSIFSYLWDPHGTKKISEDVTIADRNVPIDDTPIENTVEDNDDANALTLEEAKLKAERDRLWELAEGKKEVLRKKVRDTKSKFRFLLQKNNEIPEEARIPRSKFEIDPAIREPKKQRLLKGIEEIYRRHEWQSAKSILHIEKIQNFFFAEIKTFHMIVKDISHTAQTHTFRHRILTPEFERLLEQNEKTLIEEDIQLKAKMEQELPEFVLKPMPVTRVYAKELIGEYEGKKYDTKTLHQIKTLEDRLQKRYEKQLCWSELNAAKISNDYEDPEDVLSIAQAKEHLGDYKLKTSENYTGEKISVSTRRKRVIEMKLKIYEHICMFNTFVLELREEKYKILEECRALEKQLKKIQRQLPTDLQKPIPPIYDFEPCEEPEKQFDITVEMIQSRAAKKIEALGLTQRKLKQNEIIKSKTNQDIFATDSSALDNKMRGRKSTAKMNAAGKSITSGPGATGPGISGNANVGQGRLKVNLDKEALSTLKARKAFFKPKTEMGNIRLELALQFRCFQQDTILKKLQQLIGYFHDRVEKVRDERVSLQVDILLMSMKMLTLIQELDIVKEFDSTERAILERLDAQKVETSEAKERMDRQQRRLARITNDYNKLEQGISDVQKEVAQLIGEKHKFGDFLWKVYKKKIRVEADYSDSESDRNIPGNLSSSSSSGDSTDSTSQDSGSDLFKLPKQKLNPNVCPDQLDKALYEKVCELRAKRTQLEIEAETQKKVVQKIQRDYAEIQKIFNKYTGRLEHIGEEVQVLQRKKQGKMNRLDSLVVLKADQVQCLDEDEFDEFTDGSIVQRMKHHFPDIADVVLFPKDGIGKLDMRIEELKEETEEEREKHKRARHMMIRLSEELTKLEKEVAMVNQRCKEEMIAKFGKVVDLDDVCAAIINLEILDELIRLESRRNWHYRERKKIADEIEKARDRLTVLTKENSESNTLLAILVERQRDVEYFLYQQQKKEAKDNLVLEDASDSKGNNVTSQNTEIDLDVELISNEDALEELFNLEDILTRQESRIMILREAIAACKFKSGLPPLIPLRTIKEDVASCFMTVNELFALRERRNLEVETVYVGQHNETIGDSHSRFPSFVSPMESRNFGVPQHTPFDTNTNELNPNVEDLHEGAVLDLAKNNKDNNVPPISTKKPSQSPAEFVTDLIEEEEEEEEEEDEELVEDQVMEDEDFETEYRPEEVDAGENAKQKKEDAPSYPLNIIPDDQMAVPKPGAKSSDGSEEIEEEYEEDPLPVAKPTISTTSSAAPK